MLYTYQAPDLGNITVTPQNNQLIAAYEKKKPKDRLSRARFYENVGSALWRHGEEIEYGGAKCPVVSFGREVKSTLKLTEYSARYLTKENTPRKERCIKFTQLKK